jgi:hypothetical protein
MSSLPWRSIKTLAHEQGIPVEKILEMAFSEKLTLSVHFDGELVPVLERDERLVMYREELKGKRPNQSEYAFLKAISQDETIEARSRALEVWIERLLRMERGRKSVRGLIDILPEDVIRFVGGDSTELSRCFIRENDGTKCTYSLTDRTGKRPKFSVHDVVVRGPSELVPDSGGDPENLAELHPVSAAALPPVPKERERSNGHKGMAKLLDVSDRTVKNYARKKGFPIHKDKGCVWGFNDELLAWHKKHKETALERRKDRVRKREKRK